jgi:hypothetical protein
MNEENTNRLKKLFAKTKEVLMKTPKCEGKLLYMPANENYEKLEVDNKTVVND